MGIRSVRLEDDDGGALGEVSGDPHVLDGLLPDVAETDYYCLRFIDEYGDTVFNRLQMDQFLAEWDRVARHASQQPQRDMIEQVRRLAKRCRDETHLYLKFYGD